MEKTTTIGSRIRSRWVEFGLGLIVLSVALWFLFNALSAMSDSGGSTTRYQARLLNVGGLTEGAPVKVRGIKVGKVESLAIDPTQYDALMVISVDSGLVLPSDTVLRVTAENLLGEPIIILDLGTAETFVEANGLIKRTRSAASVEQLIERLLFSKDQ